MDTRYKYGVFVYAGPSWPSGSAGVQEVRLTPNAQGTPEFGEMEEVPEGSVGGMYIFFEDEETRRLAIQRMIQRLQNTLQRPQHDNIARAGVWGKEV